MYVIPLVRFEIILGVKWLCTLGAILWDFTALTLSFNYNNQKVMWQGEHVQPDKWLHAIQPQVSVNATLDYFLTDFSNLFQELKSLPPQRSCNHRITLLYGADSVAVRPYRYPQAQKDEIEKQCDAMLALRIIQQAAPHIPP